MSPHAGGDTARDSNGQQFGAKFVDGSVLAICPDCGVRTHFEYKANDGREFGTVCDERESRRSKEPGFSRTLHQLLRCVVCWHPGVATIQANNLIREGRLSSFWPHAIECSRLPPEAPKGIESEFREAEAAISARAWRGAAALLRSALEKVLTANGYDNGSLFERIETAAADGVITSARRRRAHELVRTLGNDVLHEAWRIVEPEEVFDAHHYVGRIIEDLYDERSTVLAVLEKQGRVQRAPTSTS